MHTKLASATKCSALEKVEKRTVATSNVSTTQFRHPHRSHSLQALIGTQMERFQTTPHEELNRGMGSYFFEVVKRGELFGYSNVF